MKMRTAGLALGLALMAAASPALAAAGDMKIRFGTAYFGPTGDNTVVWYDTAPEYEVSRIESGADLGGFVGFEIMVNDLVGLDATVLGTDIDVEEQYIWTSDGEVLGEWSDFTYIWMTPVLFSTHFHFLGDGPVDLYAGPTVGFVWYGDWEWDSDFDEFDYRVGNGLGYGAVVGFDAPFGSSRWMFSSAVRYFETGAELNETGFAHSLSNYTIDIDPWIVQVGVGVKF